MICSLFSFFEKLCAVDDRPTTESKEEHDTDGQTIGYELSERHKIWNLAFIDDLEMLPRGVFGVRHLQFLHHFLR